MEAATRMRMRNWRCASRTYGSHALSSTTPTAVPTRESTATTPHEHSSTAASRRGKRASTGCPGSINGCERHTQLHPLSAGEEIARDSHDTCLACNRLCCICPACLPVLSPRTCMCVRATAFIHVVVCDEDSPCSSSLPPCVLTACRLLQPACVCVHACNVGGHAWKV